MQETFLCLNPDTFIWSKNTAGLVYNSENGKGFRFNNLAIKPVIEVLQDLENLYCIPLNHNDSDNKYLNEFLLNIKRCQAGNLISQLAGKQKPINLPPLLNLQSDKNRIEKVSPELLGDNMLHYLMELTIHLDTTTQNTSGSKMKVLVDFLNSLLFSSLKHVLIKSEDILLFTRSRIFSTIKNIPAKKSIYVKLNDIRPEFLSANIFSPEQFVLVIRIENFDNLQKIHQVIKKMDEKKIAAEFEFLIRDEEEYQIAENLVEKYQLTGADIKPLFIGGNLKIFENNIFLTEEDLQEPCLNKREVFTHQALNTNYFGKLTIMPNGKVYAHPNYPPLGTIEDDIRELIYQEMTQGNSWLYIRDMKPCCDCIYQWLCPSPSDYELVIGKPNLCHVQP
ncbi:MAG: TIGR04150 pseudo-rSAM protein [Cyclobacteriaceae bacterium]